MLTATRPDTPETRTYTVDGVYVYHECKGAAGRPDMGYRWRPHRITPEQDLEIRGGNLERMGWTVTLEAVRELEENQ